MSIIKERIKRIICFIKKKEMIPIPYPIYANRMLEGKRALITGGSSGIGYAIAKAFVENGCEVVIAGRHSESLKRAVREIGSATHYIELDVKDISSFQDKVTEVETILSGKSIDILVNSAGITNQHDFFNMTEYEYDSIMNTNVKGAYFLSQIFGKRMIENGIKGHILNVSSSSALRPAWTPYQLSKWSIRGFTLGLADILLPYGIIVNAIAPGPTATPMLNVEEGDNIYRESLPTKRYAMPVEMATLAVYLVSSFGDMIVGDTVYATGGSGILDLKN